TVSGSNAINVAPTQTTTYTLTATNSTGSVSASVKVTVAAAASGPSAPTLLYATAKSSTEVDVSWQAGSTGSNPAGYQILRNGALLISLPASTASYADTSVSASTTYIYSVKAFDAANNFSNASNSISVTTPSAPVTLNCPGPANSAFTGCYYNNTNLSGNPALVRTDNSINFTWGSGTPGAGLTPGNYSAQWQGYFPFNSGNYTFTVTASDGIRMYIDGVLVLNQWMIEAPTNYTVQENMSAGSHLISVAYYEQSGNATAQVSWQQQQAAPPPPPSPSPQGPAIMMFTSSPDSSYPGFPVTLTWSVSGASSVSIDNGIGTVPAYSSITVYPTQTTTYTLTANNGSGQSTASVTVTISGSGRNR
ncbi:MAG: hypothetical protein JO022_12165, partial [Acidobacteriaceae bacterium]|nr:hypothetical protein [Acidobacteriaceae bacterium]